MVNLILYSSPTNANVNLYITNASMENTSKDIARKVKISMLKVWNAFYLKNWDATRRLSMIVLRSVSHIWPTRPIAVRITCARMGWKARKFATLDCLIMRKVPCALGHRVACALRNRWNQRRLLHLTRSSKLRLVENVRRRDRRRKLRNFRMNALVPCITSARMDNCSVKRVRTVWFTITFEKFAIIRIVPNVKTKKNSITILHSQILIVHQLVMLAYLMKQIVPCITNAIMVTNVCNRV